jgi:hypothetical protein
MIFPHDCIRETYSGTNLSRTRENRCPLAQNPQKIPESAIRNHCSSEKTLRIQEENPAVWYSSSTRQPVITPNAPPRSIK